MGGFEGPLPLGGVAENDPTSADPAFLLTSFSVHLDQSSTRACFRLDTVAGEEGKFAARAKACATWAGGTPSAPRTRRTWRRRGLISGVMLGRRCEISRTSRSLERLFSPSPSRSVVNTRLVTTEPVCGAAGQSRHPGGRKADSTLGARTTRFCAVQLRRGGRLIRMIWLERFRRRADIRELLRTLRARRRPSSSSPSGAADRRTKNSRRALAVQQLNSTSRNLRRVG